MRKAGIDFLELGQQLLRQARHFTEARVDLPGVRHANDVVQIHAHPIAVEGNEAFLGSQPFEAERMKGSADLVKDLAQ